ncbi:putative response regulator receiver protein [Oryzomicrobium terrae]|uniref:Putative response regulator receiver protein n=1 Tax=Oryzomicrobium terrae TaxID=1735038 RepID=A0A5C1E5A6_9RHOO|nr:HD-GYP domain-containing protein [Oryzomicrobium terrae]QEL64070.1 putative response regulator receiver protein [Oryzomicrobium terrae]
MNTLHRRAATRLFLAWLSISLLIGTGVVVFKLEQIDAYVSSLALTEAQRFPLAELEAFNRGQTSVATVEGHVRELTKGRFAIVELYGPQRETITEVVQPGSQAIEDALRPYAHPFPLGDEVHYIRREIDDQWVVQVVVPLRVADGPLAGYLEGVYVVDAAARAQIRRDLLISLLVVLAAVLVTSLALYPILISLNRDVLRFSSQVLRGNLDMLEVLGSAIAKRDSDTNIHNYRVTLYALELAKAAGLPASDQRHLVVGAFLHDVGKIGISDAILLKPGKLSAEEFEVMKTHVDLGVDIIQTSTWLNVGRDVVEGHHEKFDGSGYPRGLQGEAIPLNARLFAIADVFDALTSRRPYKEPMSCEAALSVLAEGRGRHFDPTLLDTFSRIAPGLYDTLTPASDATIIDRLRREVIDLFFAGTLKGVSA